ncbi:MAG: cysteine desulfurase-like protein [Planctomycetaceae bacterium]|nr:cysteine desulfurase-like protein [Planctomycetaceae bacterium]
MSCLDLNSIRSQFPALRRQVQGHPAIYFDGPAGSQAPQRVIDAVADSLTHRNANRGGAFATSQESDALLDKAHRALADFVGAQDPDEVVFGANMTTMTLALSRALGKTWSAGDEILLSRLDHDANVTPWVLAARDAGATVRHVNVRPGDCTLDMEDFVNKLSPRTRLVAVGYASNAVGTINPIAEIVDEAHRVGAVVFVDAVHFAPHGLIDVASLQCDFLACSAYKFFGPHVGVMWGRRSLWEAFSAYKVRPAPELPSEKWMTGTQNHEGIAGAAAAVDYLADLGADGRNGAGRRRDALTAAFSAIRETEQQHVGELLEGLARLPQIRIWGITDPARFDHRVPTVSFTHANRRPRELAAALAEQGIFVWAGNHYALPLTEALGLEPEGTLRVGLLHYNTSEEITRFLDVLQTVCR